MKPHNISHRLRLEEERWKQIEKVHGIEQELQAVQYEIEWLSRMDGAQNDKELAIKEQTPIIINVSNTLFATSLKTLTNQETLLSALVSTELPVDRDKSGALYIDRDPRWFSVILDHLRTGKVSCIGIPEYSLAHMRQILAESQYYGTERLSAHLRLLIRLRNTQERKYRVVEDHIETKNNDGFLIEFEKLSIQQRHTDHDFFNHLLNNVTQKYHNAKSKRDELLKEYIGDAHLEFNIGGVLFKIDSVYILRQGQSLLYDLIDYARTEPTFIDRDPTTFRYIHEFLMTGRTDHFPKQVSIRNQIHEEAKFYRLQPLLQYFDPTRYPIETIGEENIKMKQIEDTYRALFIQDRNNPLLSDPYLNLLPLFEIIDSFSLEAPPLSIPLLFNLEDGTMFRGVMEPSYWELEGVNNMKTNLGTPPRPDICGTFDQFSRQFEIFSSGMLNNANWNNMFVAGGSIIAALVNVDQHSRALRDELDHGREGETVMGLLGIEEDDDDIFTDDEDDDRESLSDLVKREKLHYVHRHRPPRTLNHKLVTYYAQSCYNGGDLDLFLYACDEQEAEKKIIELYNLFKENLKREHQEKYYSHPSLIQPYEKNINEAEFDETDICIIRSKTAVTFHFRYPIRPIQVILRIYKSPSEILMGFDLDSCCVGYDGAVVWCLPRFRRAIKTHMNLVDTSRQSTTYELRLYKYAKRGFRVGVPGFDRALVKNREIMTTAAFTQVGILSGECRTMPKRHFKQYHGLARLLLLEQGLAYGKREAYTEIGLPGTNDHRPNHIAMLELQVENIDPKEESERTVWTKTATDYVSLFVPFKHRYTPRYMSHRYIKALEYTRDKVDRAHRPEFIVSCNDLAPIIDNTDPSRSTLVGHISWLTVNPGTQVVGSFNPVDANFYEDAYCRTEAQEQIIERAREKLVQEEQAKKKVRVTWEHEDGAEDNYEPFRMDINVKLEKAFRNYRKKEMPDELRVCKISEQSSVDFEKMVIVGLAFGARVRRLVEPVEKTEQKGDTRYKRQRLQ